jgi:hypothetical protein
MVRKTSQRSALSHYTDWIAMMNIDVSKSYMWANTELFNPEQTLSNLLPNMGYVDLLATFWPLFTLHLRRDVSFKDFLINRDKSRGTPLHTGATNFHHRHFTVSHENCLLEQITTSHLPRELTTPISHAIKPVWGVCNECYCFPYLVLDYHVWSALMSETSMMGNHSAGGPHLHHTLPSLRWLITPYDIHP